MNKNVKLTPTDAKVINDAMNEHVQKIRREKMSNLTFTNVFYPESRKTMVWEVCGYKGAYLGWIRWRGAWRQYVFEPIGESVWSVDCLLELAAFIKEQMDAR